MSVWHFETWCPAKGSRVFKALGCSGRKAMFNESACVAPSRELPNESLKRGPLGACLGMCIHCGSIYVCEFILRVQSFISVVQCRAILVDHALIPVCVYLYFGWDPGCRYCAKTYNCADCNYKCAI